MTKQTFVKLASGEIVCATTTTTAAEIIAAQAAEIRQLKLDGSLILRIEAAIEENPNDQSLQALKTFLSFQRKGAARFNRQAAGRTAKQISEGMK